MKKKPIYVVGYIRSNRYCLNSVSNGPRKLLEQIDSKRPSQKRT